MAFRFGDPGGRMYQAAGAGNANLLAHWTSLPGIAAGTISVLASGGRGGGTCLRIVTSSATSLGKTLTSQATLGLAAAFRSTVLPGAATLIAFTDSGTAQCDLRIDSTGAITVTRNGTVLGTVSGAMSIGTWIHLEFRVTFHDTAGTVFLGVNGVQRLNLTSQDTKNTANASANVVQVGGVGGFNGTLDLDDIIIYDGAGTDANGFADIGAITGGNPTGTIGDCRLTWLLPTGAGTTTQFTPDSGANWARVGEATPDITSYAESGTIGNIDTYAIADLAAGSGGVKSVAIAHYARKTDVGARGMKAVIRSGGGNAVHATEVSLSDSYLYSFAPYGQDPNNGTPIAWTPAAVNALEVGQTCSS